MATNWRPNNPPLISVFAEENQKSTAIQESVFIKSPIRREYAGTGWLQNTPPRWLDTPIRFSIDAWRVEHWDNAVEQGRVAMRNMRGHFQPFIHVPYFFSDVFDLSYEFWGDAKGHDQVVYRGNMKQKPPSVARTSSKF